MAAMNYLDFDLLIESMGERYKARVLNSPAGQAIVDFSLPFTELEIENFLLKIGRPRRGVRRADSPEMEAAKTFGSRLFETVFNGDLLGCLYRSLDEVNRQQAGLRLRLRLADVPILAEIPWEYLYNPTLNRFLSLSVETPLVRYLDLPERIQPLAVKPPLNVLVMISSPNGYPELNVEHEWSKVNKALGELERQGIVTLERLEQATLSALQKFFRRKDCHIFHFIGHGIFDTMTQDGMLIFEDDKKQGRPVSGQYLGTLLHDKRTLRLAVLNACEGARSSSIDPFSGTAQSVVQQGIPAVIAMQFEVTDEVAIDLAHEFYTALADGYPVDAALTEARKAIYAQGNVVEWATPVLYMRSPDGGIFSQLEFKDRKIREEQDKPTFFSDTLHKLDSPEGAVRIGSKLYVQRKNESIWLEYALNLGETILIKGAGQTGKSSLLARMYQAARNQNRSVLSLDFRSFDKDSFSNLDSLLRHLAELIAERLHTVNKPDKYWSSKYGVKTKIYDFICSEILVEEKFAVLFLLDNVDILLDYPYRDEFFSLIRAWHDERAWNERLTKLNIVLAYSTEASLFIQDLNQTPFMVGRVIELMEFSRHEIEELNARHNYLIQEDELYALMQLLGGHPYLWRKALEVMIVEKLNVSELIAAACNDEGPFDNHLRRYLNLLVRDSNLRHAMQEVISHHKCTSNEAFYKLRSAGLVSGSSAVNARVRCQLYEKYFETRL